MPKRLVFFVHDGSGLGHLRRCARIAAALQGPCACLVVSGHRAAAWIVPDTCELLYLPSWDSFFTSRSAHWSRVPWMELSRHDAASLRSALLEDMLRHFRPDAVFVDYLPFGQHGELRSFIERADCTKYFVLRGLIDQEDRACFADYFEVIAKYYDRVLVTADRRTIDVESEYQVPESMCAKLAYVGYVLPDVCDRSAIRAQWVPDGAKWVVCSGGGGFRAERLLRACMDIARGCRDVRFDIVLGPRTTAPNLDPIPGRCAVWPHRSDLPALHAAADVVVTSGGYNSVLEAMAGGARLVVHARPGGADEPWEHARRLAAWYPIDVVEEEAGLAGAVRHALEQAPPSQGTSFPLNGDGIENTRRIVFHDLGLAG